MGRFQDLLRVPGVQMPKFHLTTFENPSLCVIGSVERSVLWCLHRAGVMCRHSVTAPDELLFV